MKDNNKVRTLIDIPADGNYIEILGHRIDGFESFEAFLEYLKKYAELEETVNRQKAEIKALNTENKQLQSDFITANQYYEHTKEQLEKAIKISQRSNQRFKEAKKELQNAKSEVERLERHTEMYHEVRVEAFKEYTVNLISEFNTLSKSYGSRWPLIKIDDVFKVVKKVYEKMVGAESG